MRETWRIAEGTSQMGMGGEKKVYKDGGCVLEGGPSSKLKRTAGEAFGN